MAVGAVSMYLLWKVLIPPRVADFFAYFDPKKRLGSHDILFLICCPAHQREKEKHDLEKDGLTPYYDVVTSNIKMIPGHDRAFVFVSGGINFASSEDMAGGFYLRLVQILSKRKKDQRSFVQRQFLGKTSLVSAASSLLDVPEMSWGEVSLFWFILVDLVLIISNYAPTRAKWRTEGKGDPKDSFVRGCYVRSRFHQL